LALSFFRDYKLQKADIRATAAKGHFVRVPTISPTKMLRVASMAGLVKLHCGNWARDEWPVWAAHVG
jgi:hypothetical protein